jgi:hypothetical protein
MLRNLTSKMNRRRILLLIAVSTGILVWCLLRPSTGLPREVAAIGGRFENVNSDIPSGTRALNPLSYLDAVVRIASRKSRYSAWIDFSRSRVTDEWLTEHGESFQQYPIHSLYFFRCSVSDAGLRALPKLPELSILDLSGTSVTDLSAETVSNFPNLDQILLANTKITDETIRILAVPQRFRAITINGEVLTDAAIISLAAMPQLSALGLNRVNSEELSRVSKLRNVTYLTLRGAGDDLVPMILKLNQLQTLILEDSRLSSESLRRIRQGLPKVDVRDSYMSAEESTDSGLYEQIQLQGYLIRLFLISAILVVGYMVRVMYGIGRRLWFRRRRESAT